MTALKSSLEVVCSESLPDAIGAIRFTANAQPVIILSDRLSTEQRKSALLKIRQLSERETRIVLLLSEIGD